MGKKSKGNLSKKSKPSKTLSKRTSIPTPQFLRNVNFNATESVTYAAVPLSETEDPNAESGSAAATTPSKSKSKQPKGKNKKVKKKSKRRARPEPDSDDDSVVLKRKPSPVLAPLPSLTTKQYDFFELVRDGDTEKVATFLKSNKFKDMNINKLNKSGFTVLHIAVRRNDVHMVNLLLKQPGIHLYDTLLYAIREENIEIAKMLLGEYDQTATEEQRQRLMNSAMTLTQDPNQQEQLSKMVNTSVLAVSPVVSPLSTRSGVKSSIKLNSTNVSKKSKVKMYRARSFYEPKTDIPTTSVSQLENPADDDDDEEIPFDSEFSPVVTPLMLAAQQGSYSLIELFYSRNERLETEEFHHDFGCSCDICAKLEGEQDMTRAYQRYHLYKALTNPDYMCFLGRTEHKDPINYALKKITKIRELIKVDHAFGRLFNGLEEELEEFVTKMLELCRSTTETEIFLSPKDTDERLPHSYPRLWYTVGQDLKKFVTSPNAQNIVYKMWATDDWPEWDALKTPQLIMEIALRVTLWPLIGILLYCDTSVCRCLKAPVSRFVTYIGSYLFFMLVVGVQALYPYQRCNNGKIPWPSFIIDRNLTDDDNCTQRGPPRIGTEPILMLYILSFYVNMVKRQSVSWYWRMRWNWVELIDQLLFTAMFGCWVYSFIWTLQDENQKILIGTKRTMWPPDCAEIVGECLLAMAFLLAFVRILRFVIVVPACGPIQIGISHQVTDFVKGLLIMAVVIIAFGSGLMGLYMPYKELEGTDPEDKVEKPITDDSFHDVASTFKALFWILHGKQGVDTIEMATWLVETNKSTGKLEENHHNLNEGTGKFLFLGYHLIGALMLQNMLAGYFSQTMTQIEDNLDVYWKYARTELFLTFIKDTIIPPPLNLFPPWSKLKRGCEWLKFLGRKNGRKASCSLRQCCFVTTSEKKDRWEEFMRGYRKLILQLIFRYMNAHTEAKGEDPPTKDDVLEIAEGLVEIKAFLKKVSENLPSSDDDDDDDYQFPGAMGYLSRTKTGWKKTKTILQSSGGSTFLKNKVRSGGPSGAPSGNSGVGPSGAPSGNSGGGPSGAPSGNSGVGPSGAPSGNSGVGPSGAPSGNSGGRPSGALSGNSKMNANSEPNLSQQPSRSKSKPGNSGKSTPQNPSQQTINSVTNSSPKRDPSAGGNTVGNVSIKSINSAKVVEKIANDFVSMRRDSPQKRSTTSNRSNPNEVEKGSRTGGAIERNPGLEEFSDVCGIDSVPKSVASSSNPLPNNNNSLNSTKMIVNPTKGNSQPKVGSKSGSGPVQDTCAYNNTQIVTGNPSKSSKISSGPTSIQSQVTPKTPISINNGITATTAPTQGTLSNNNQKTTKNACDYAQPRRGSRSGGGLERPPEIGDFSGPGEIDEPYKPPSRSTNNSYSIVEMGATSKKSPIPRDSTQSTPTSKVSNLNTRAITKEPSLKSIKTLQSTNNDKPCGRVPSGRTTANINDYTQPRRGSRSGGGLERSPEMGDFSGPGEIDEPYKPPSRSTNNFYSIPAMEATSKKSPKPQDFTRSTPTSKANNVNSGPIPKEPSFKSIKTLQSSTNVKPCDRVSSGTTTVSNNDNTQPRRGSRSGGGLERPPETGDFSGPGEIDEPYKPPSRSTNNSYSIVEMGATSKKSPIPQDFTRSTPTSMAYKINTGAIPKEPSVKSIKNIKSTTNDQPCGGVPSGRTTANINDYAQPRRGSRSGGGLERSAEMGDFSGPGEIDEPYKSLSRTTNNYFSIAEIGATSKKSTGIQDYTSKSPDNNQSGRKPCSTCTVKPSAAAKAGCSTCSVKPSASAGTTLRKEKDSLFKGAAFSNEIPRGGSGKLVDVWPTTSTIAGSTRDIPGYLGASAGPTSAATKLNIEDRSPKFTEVTFRASKKPKNGDNQNSPSKSPSLVPSPAAKIPSVPAMPPTFSSDSSGDATDGSSKANDYKNPQPNSKSKQRDF